MTARRSRRGGTLRTRGEAGRAECRSILSSNLWDRTLGSQHTRDPVAAGPAHECSARCQRPG
jgi:hypothetical protein